MQQGLVEWVSKSRMAEASCVIAKCMNTWSLALEIPSKFFWMRVTSRPTVTYVTCPDDIYTGREFCGRYCVEDEVISLLGSSFKEL